jgi:hypothetical protein
VSAVLQCFFGITSSLTLQLARFYTSLLVDKFQGYCMFGKDQYAPFFDTLLSIIDEVTGAIANPHGQHQVVSSANKELPSSTKSVIQFLC